MSIEENARAIKALRSMQCDNAAEAIWEALGGLGRVEAAEVLFSFLRKYAKNGRISRTLLASEEALKTAVRGVRLTKPTSSPSQRQKQIKQQSEQYRDTLRCVPCQAPPWDSFEGGLDRVALGVPARVDRLRALGNAVVPQVVEVIGNAILQKDNPAP